MTFTKWSNINKESNLSLKPNFGIRKWNDLEERDRKIIIKHLNNKGWFKDTDLDVYVAVSNFHNDHKARSFCNHLLDHGGPHLEYGILEQCCYEAANLDGVHIFYTEPQDVVYELISYVASRLESLDDSNDKLDRFVSTFNDISNQFGLDILLSQNGIILRQEDKINENIYEPVFNYLADKKFKTVSREFSDAFSDYSKNTPEGFSSCITHTVSGLQAFLQIIINNDTQKGDIAELVNKGIKNKTIPNDPFSARVFKDLVSILMQERQDKGDSHPKKEYANEKSARLIINLSMIFMQHCLQP